MYAGKTDVNLPFNTQEGELSHLFIFLSEIRAGFMFHSVIPPLFPRHTHTHTHTPTYPPAHRLESSESRNGHDPYNSVVFVFFLLHFVLKHISLGHLLKADVPSSWVTPLATQSLNSEHTTRALRIPILTLHSVTPLSKFLFLLQTSRESRFAPLKENFHLLFFLSLI